MEPKAGIEGKQIVYREELQPGQYVESYLTGYSSNPSDYDIVVEDTRTGVGVEQTGDNPISLSTSGPLAPPFALRPTITW